MVTIRLREDSTETGLRAGEEGVIYCSSTIRFSPGKTKNRVTDHFPYNFWWKFHHVSSIFSVHFSWLIDTYDLVLACGYVNCVILVTLFPFYGWEQSWGKFKYFCLLNVSESECKQILNSFVFGCDQGQRNDAKRKSVKSIVTDWHFYGQTHIASWLPHFLTYRIQVTGKGEKRNKGGRQR